MGLYCFFNLAPHVGKSEKSLLYGWSSEAESSALEATLDGVLLSRRELYFRGAGYRSLCWSGTFHSKRHRKGEFELGNIRMRVPPPSNILPLLGICALKITCP